ncbi:MAG: phosphotransferase [Anaerolineaceae bacterium]|nr:phosphotransferase [Anaerolineaceae bacterium]
MSAPAKNQTFVQLVQKIFPHSKLLRIWSLKGGISAGMTALEIEHQDGSTQRMIVRQPSEKTLANNPRAAENEYSILRILHTLGLAVQRPVYLDQSGAIFPTPYLVIEYISGKPEFSPSNAADLPLQLAVHLAKIHSLDCSALDLSFLPKQAVEGSSIPGSHSSNSNQSLSEDRIRDILQSASPLPPRNPPRLLHGDYWPGNILWQADKLAAVVDWEDAAVGDPLADFSISRLDILWIYGMDAMISFTRHYQSLMSIDYTDLPYWDLSAALRLARLAGADLAGWAAFFLPFGRTDITEQTIREHYRFFISQAFEKLAPRC